VPARGPVSAALGAANSSYRIVSDTEGFKAVTAAQHLETQFASTGVRLNSGRMSLGLSVDGLGYGGATRPVGMVAPRERANRISYDRPGLSEWYVNGPLGVEQGFTIPRAPSGSHAGPLTLSIAVSGAAGDALSADGRTVTFSQAGAPRLRYGDLAARDARGRSLRAWFQSARGRLLLHVDDRGARYPVQIDPFIQLGEPLNGESDEVGEGRLGSSVALSSDGATMVVGAPFDNSNAGAVWVFTRSGTTWTQQGKKLTGAEESGAGEFGISVALSSNGNTALIGGHEDNGGTGAAWVFTRSGSTWTQQGKKLTGGGETGPGKFGRSVALSSNGNTALIGGTTDEEESHARGAA